MKFYCCHVCVGCMLYVGIPGVAGIGVTAGAGERGNNGLDVAIILDPPGLNCPNQEEKRCVRAKVTDCYFNTDGYCKL